MNWMELHDWSEICSFFSIIQFKSNPYLPFAVGGTHIYSYYIHIQNIRIISSTIICHFPPWMVHYYTQLICLSLNSVLGSFVLWMVLVPLSSVACSYSFLLLGIDSVLLTSTNCNCGNCMSSSVLNFVYYFTTLGKNVGVRIYWREIM